MCVLFVVSSALCCANASNTRHLRSCLSRVSNIDSGRLVAVAMLPDSGSDCKWLVLSMKLIVLCYHFSIILLYLIPNFTSSIVAYFIQFHIWWRHCYCFHGHNSWRSRHSLLCSQGAISYGAKYLNAHCCDKLSEILLIFPNRYHW